MAGEFTENPVCFCTRVVKRSSSLRNNGESAPSITTRKCRSSVSWPDCRVRFLGQGIRSSSVAGVASTVIETSSRLNRGRHLIAASLDQLEASAAPLPLRAGKQRLEKGTHQIHDVVLVVDDAHLLPFIEGQARVRSPQGEDVSHAQVITHRKGHGGVLVHH